MTKPRNRNARTTALSGVTLALGLFASADLAAAGAPSSQPSTPTAATASTECDMTSERCDVNREARETGFGRRGGDK